MFLTLMFVVRVVMYNVRFVPSPAAAYVTAVAWGLPLLSSVDRVAERPSSNRIFDSGEVGHWRSLLRFPAPTGRLVDQLHAVYGASEGTGGRRITENFDRRLHSLIFVRSSTWLGAAIRTSHGRRMLHMAGRLLTVENGTGARLGRQIEAAQKLRVERDDDR